MGDRDRNRETGFLDQEVFDAFERRLSVLFQDASSVDYWAANRYRFAESFQDYVDTIIERDTAK